MNFLQIHFLTSYPGVLLNRDDAGFAKRMPFGNAVRTRISSQCLKRHWRMYDGPGSFAEIGVGDTIRSRLTFQKEVVEPLIAEGFDAKAVLAATETLKNVVLGQSEKNKAEEGKGKKGKKGATDETEAPAAKEDVKTEQVTVLGRPEIEFFKTIVRKAATESDAAKAVNQILGVNDKGKISVEGRKNMEALRAAMAGGLSSAMFGRMITSDVLARSDAAIHVAHALTVHAEQSEADYFSAIDDLMKEDGELGSGHIGTTELTSGLYYGYVVVDLPLLVSNITGCSRKGWKAADRTIAAEVVERLIKIISKVSPGAKLGSTAPYSYARWVMVEGTDQQPSTLANAFESAVGDDDTFQDSIQRIGKYLHEFDRVYGFEGERIYTGIDVIENDIPNATFVDSIKDVAGKAASWVKG